MKLYKTYSSKGFTLVELLIVIAVLGILAAVVLVAIDPLEQLARGRDAGRKTAIGQLGHALQAYFTAREGVGYISTVDPYQDGLVSAGELKTPATNPNYAAIATPTCAGGDATQGNYCYHVVAGNQDAIVYTRLESKAEISKCPTAPNTVPWFVWTSNLGRAGGYCSTPTPPSSTLTTLSF